MGYWSKGFSNALGSFCEQRTNIFSPARWIEWQMAILLGYGILGIFNQIDNAKVYNVNRSANKERKKERKREKETKETEESYNLFEWTAKHLNFIRSWPNPF